MKLKNKRVILFPALLLLYLTILAVITYPRYRASGEWGEYIGVITVSVLLVILLHRVLKRKQKIRDRFNHHND